MKRKGGWGGAIVGEMGVHPAGQKEERGEEMDGAGSGLLKIRELNVCAISLEAIQ